MSRFTDIIKRLKEFITNDIWSLDLDEFSMAKARMIKYLKVI